MDEHTISRLDDKEYEQLVLKNAHPPVRDPDVWAALTAPENLERTRNLVDAVAQRTGNALRTRKAERDQFHQQCLARGAAGKKEWFDTRADFEDWKRRAGNFHQCMLKAKSELNKVQKDVNREAGHQLAQDQRDTLRRLALAVNKHQAVHAKTGGIAEQADYELWQALDRLTVPVGPEQQHVSLRTMLDIYWSDVTPVNEDAERLARGERTMRAAPAGQSTAYAGVPKARHVHNDKKLT
ncbi:hypothetical protein GCM10010277_73900 [Streptomyces longisporoflavus]|uniref:hypothetical protein n=1 Tax=Streptomyces longisporoflavus TaxID=28044 RepID=UPI00167D3DB7|nr:hypothetical protein [Streptomyces longisporoflavus]GGV66205.1 hypothetical protein GCM10010277_73900 [Streptomyces longisporoflavus]